MIILVGILISNSDIIHMYKSMGCQISNGKMINVWSGDDSIKICWIAELNVWEEKKGLARVSRFPHCLAPIGKTDSL